jgi:hypothetical protein
MLLRYTAELILEAAMVDEAVQHVLDIGVRPADLAGSARASTTNEVGEAVEHTLAELIDHRRSYHAV